MFSLDCMILRLMKQTAPCFFLFFFLLCLSQAGIMDVNETLNADLSRTTAESKRSVFLHSFSLYSPYFQFNFSLFLPLHCWLSLFSCSSNAPRHCAWFECHITTCLHILMHIPSISLSSPLCRATAILLKKCLTDLYRMGGPSGTIAEL